jgi:formylmethanofuran dehydrogenase subunit C
MSMNLTLHTAPEVPVEAEVLSPDGIAGLNDTAVVSLTLLHGNQRVPVGDFFKVTGKCNGVIHIEGDLSRIKHIGAGMSAGQIIIHGDVGAHLGAGMSGGEIVVNGNAGDWVGPEMSGGRITITGNAGHLVGSAYRGSTTGMQGGEIIVHGNVKNETGHAMRNGLIAVGGGSGDFTGVNMNAGTIIVLGEMGIRSGAGMKRGTIVSMHKADILPTFTFACLYGPVYLRILLQHIKRLGLPVDNEQMQGQYHRWSGDGVELNRGEILIYQMS